MPTRSEPPMPSPVRPFDLPPVEVDVLGNGLRLRSLRRATVPLVSASLVLDAGEVGIPDAHGGLAVLTGDSLQGGTERLTGAELADELEGLGSGFRVSTGWDGTTIGFTCVAERLDAMLALLSEMLRTPAFPEDEIARVRGQRLAAIAQRRMDPGDLADDAIDRVVFDGGHPYHRPLAGTNESVASLDDGAVRTFFEERYAPSGAGLVVVGDLLAEEVRAAAGRHFDGWTTAGRAHSSPSVMPEIGERRAVIVSRPGAVQSEIRIGHPGPSRGVAEEIPLRVANLVLGGAIMV